MRPSVSRRVIAADVTCCLGLLIVLSCQADRAVAPGVGQPSFAKGGRSADPTVTSTTPSGAHRDTTLDVTVSGSGFDQGSRVIWALDGDTTLAKTKVTTNSTTYVSGRQLIANITIGMDAAVDLYDVEVVTLSGRKGIGIELFAISVMADLGGLNDSLSSTAYDVNDRGTIVGAAQVRDALGTLGGHAVKWTPTATGWTITDLSPQLGSGESNASAINTNGDIVGSRRYASGQVGAFLMTPDGTVTDLGVPPGLFYSDAYDINANREVVGTTGLRNAPSQPYYWSAATGLILLPGLPGATVREGGAASINDNGVIAGYTTDGTTGFAVRWERVGGVWTATKLPSGEGIGPQEISNTGNIVGVGCQPNVSPCVNRAYFWPAAGARVDLGTLGGTISEAYGVNDAGRVVGKSTTKAGSTRAFSWTMSGGMKELGTFGSGKSVAFAQAINNAGMIVGTNSYAFSPWHGALWIVP